MSTFAISHFFQRLGFNSRSDSQARKNERVTLASGVYLMGGGCGDPELITVKAQRVIEHADVLLVDWLVNPEVYRNCRKNCKVIFVGKKCGRHSVTQAEIDKLLIKYAQKYSVVGRLKGGDPSIFGRLAEETEILTAHNIPFCIIPGVTAASGCAAYSGIPLTMRDVAQSVKFVTAHLKDLKDEPSWQDLVKDNQTLVFYMGLSRINMIAKRLTDAGMPSKMSIAVIEQGTMPEQSVWIGSLKEAKTITLDYMRGPALIVVGEVVKYRQRVSLTMLGHSLSTETCHG